jgi:hypothetical protein
VNEIDGAGVRPLQIVETEEERAVDAETLESFECDAEQLRVGRG